MKDNCCGGTSLPSNSNELEILVRQLKREVEKLMTTTEARLLCQSNKIDETMVYIKNNLSNALRDLLDSMIESGEMEQIIIDIINGDVNTLIGRVEEVEQDVNNINDEIDIINNTLTEVNSSIDNITKSKSKMVVIGDSWSIEDYPYISDINNMWQHLVSKQLGLELVNYARSGAGFTINDNSFLIQANNCINDLSDKADEVKYIFIFGGINDLNFGTPSNLESACNTLINTLKNYFTNSQIILCGCNTQVTFRKGDNNPTYNTMDITKILQESAYENGITFIDTQPFLYGIPNTINIHLHPSIEGLKAIANGILSSLNSTYTRVANSNGNASYTLTSDMDNAPTMIVQSSCKNNTLTLLFFINNITSSNSSQTYLYRIPEMNLPYMNAEPLKNLSDAIQHGCIWVTSEDAKFFRVRIDANYSGSLYFEKQIQI